MFDEVTITGARVCQKPDLLVKRTSLHGFMSVLLGWIFQRTMFWFDWVNGRRSSAPKKTTLGQLVYGHRIRIHTLRPGMKKPGTCRAFGLRVDRGSLLLGDCPGAELARHDCCLCVVFVGHLARRAHVAAECAAQSFALVLQADVLGHDGVGRDQ